jgi:hypothetical protein
MDASEARRHWLETLPPEELEKFVPISEDEVRAALEAGARDARLCEEVTSRQVHRPWP